MRPLSCRLRTLGAALLESPEGPQEGAAGQRRRFAVLALLAAHPSGISRDRIVGMLWPDSSEDRARHALSQLIYALRSELGADAIVGRPTALRLDPSVLPSDVRALEAALDAGELERAAELYRGPFLDGFYLNNSPDFERWVEEVRARLARRVESACERLALRASEAGDREAEVAWWTRRVALSPLDTRATLALMRALAGQGNRTAAVLQARAHATRVREELGCDPDPAVTELAGELAPPSTEPRADGGSGASSRFAEPPNQLPRVAAPAAQPIAARRRRARRLVLAGGGFLAMASVVVVVTGLVVSGRGHTPELALIADVENATGDPVFDRSVPVAIAASLAQSRAIHVLPPTRIHSALERMRRVGADSALREPLARELAQREGVALVIVPSVVRADSGFEISARAVNASTGSILGAVAVPAARRADVIDALDRLGRRLRRVLGEPLLYVSAHTVPLPRVTTPSLDALEKFASGSRAFESNRLAEAKDDWTAAVAIDSNFASALAALGGYYYWVNQPSAGDRWFARALSHLGGLPEREQVLIHARVESWRGDRDSSTRLLGRWVRSHPDDLDALGMLAYDEMRLHRNAEALQALTRLAALDSTSQSTFINLATTEKQLGRVADAIAHYRRAFALVPALETANNNLNLEYGEAWVAAGEPDSAAAVFSELLAGDAQSRARGLRSLAFLAMYRGQYREACAKLAETFRLLSPGTAAVSVVRNRLLLATALGRTGADRASRAQLDSAFALTRRFDAEPTLLYWEGMALARAGNVRRAGVLRDVMRPRMHAESATDRAALEGLTGEILVAAHRAAEAIPHLEAALRADSSDLTLESLARGVAMAGDLARAVPLYDALARDVEFGWEGQEAWHFAPYEAGRLAERLGRTAQAADAYARFLARWQGGDADVPAVAEARARLARLAPMDAAPATTTPVTRGRNP